MQIPISEGIVNRTFAALGAILLKDALRRSPLLFGLGMGGIDRPLPKLFRALGASMREVPFFFRVTNAASFLRNAVPLRRRPLLRMGSGVAAFTGLGRLSFGVVHGVRSFSAVGKRTVRVDTVTKFDHIADQIWEAAAPNYSCVSFRDSETLNYLYPLSDTRYHRLVIHEQGKLAGCAVVTDSQMKDHNYFGNMRVGAIANCLAMEQGESAVIAGASQYLRDRGVDLIVSNQFHPAWTAGLRRAGYLNYRSNFGLALAPALSKKIQANDAALSRVHMNRGDGDGAYNL
jgi:hypothetical protein